MNHIRFYQAAKATKAWLEMLAYPYFNRKGRIPHHFGYNYYKKKEILRAITSGAFNGGRLTPGYGYRLDERIVEYPWLFSSIPAGSGALLDAGSALNHGYLLSREPLRSKRIFVSTLAPEPTCLWYRGHSYVYEDLRSTCYRSDFFDLIASISTIEHIGLDNTMLYTADRSKKEQHYDDYLNAVSEYRRVLRPGGRLYISVPYGKYANHGWFQVFNAEMVECIIDTAAPRSHSAFYFKYESNGWRSATAEELTEATFFDIHQGKRLDADFAAGARGLVCLEMVK